LLQFVRRYLLPYSHWYLVGITAVFATNWMSVTIPLYLADGIDALLEPNESTVDRVRWDALVVAVMGFAVILVRTVSRVAFFTPGRLVEAKLKQTVFERLIRQQRVFLRHWPTGDLISRTTSDVNYLRLLGGFAALQVVNVAAAVGLVGVQMVRISPTLALWLSIPVLIALGITRIFLRRMFLLMRRLQQGNAALSAQVLSSYQGIATAQDFSAGGALEVRFRGLNDEVLEATLERAKLRTIIGPVLSLGAAVNVCILLGVGGPMAIRGEITIGELVAFTTLVAYLTSPLRSLSFLLSLLKQSAAALERVNAVLEPPIDRPEGPEGQSPAEESPAITVSGLSFAYPEAPEQLVLSDLSFSIPAGGTLGVVGMTGAGKSTLLRCLSRVYNPPPGTVFVDGVDVRDLDLDEWRSRMAYVPQRAFLFSESLRDNILLGADERSIFEQVIEQTALRPDIEALPDGVDTQVGEAGLMLSGGQRQRTALARGLAREHRFLLLDDVLSAVDHETEDALIHAIRAYGKGPTTIIVAHRLSAIRHADWIVVIREGSLLQAGTHDDLVSRPGLYAEIWDHQRRAS
jgi:ATP-binding cassette, subfamily B, multidrug efflux pump